MLWYEHKVYLQHDISVSTWQWQFGPANDQFKTGNDHLGPSKNQLPFSKTLATILRWIFQQEIAGVMKESFLFF